MQDSIDNTLDDVIGDLYEEISYMEVIVDNNTSDNIFCITFTVSAQPITKSNQLLAHGKSSSGRPMFFIPKKYKDYAKLIKHAAVEAMHGISPVKGLVSMDIAFYPKDKRIKDLPNLPKTLCDAINKVVYTDDSEIGEIRMWKMLDRVNPRTEVIVRIDTEHKWWDQKRIQ